VDGPGVWRGGYNSGQTNSINHRHLELECGINRVAVRSTMKPGMITIRAHSQGLKPASIAINSLPVPVEGGVTRLLTKLPQPDLGSAPVYSDFSQKEPMIISGLPKTDSIGRFTEAFSYSGPGGSVQLMSNVQGGKEIYVDQKHRFVGLPDELAGADWVQAAGSDSRYDAVDLMELAVAARTVVSVAHDDRLSRPEWLRRQFRPTDLKLLVAGQPMTVFQSRVDEGQSLTLGANVEVETNESCHMYVVFVNGHSSLDGQARSGLEPEGR
jgi:beta-galactosidase